MRVINFIGSSDYIFLYNYSLTKQSVENFVNGMAIAVEHCRTTSNESFITIFLSLIYVPDTGTANT